MFRIFLLAMGLALSMAGSGSAAIVTLDCKITDVRRGGGWIPRIALVKVDTASKAVQLLKPTAEQMNGRVRSAQMLRNNEEKMVLLWILNGTKSATNQRPAAFRFRASVSIIAKAVGYDNDFRGKGTCDIS